MPTFNETDQQLLDLYDEINSRTNTPAELRTIFEIAVKNRQLFPKIPNTRGEQTTQQYISSWIKKYVDENDNPPSSRIAHPKNACADPALKRIVQSVTGVSDKDALLQEKHHNLFMAAENVQGNLLEEYIANNISPYGWLWCKGKVLRSVDFCTTDGQHFLQIKNKYNSENSSSSAIREGTSIENWFRLGIQTKNGIKQPLYKWDKLNKIINDGAVINVPTPCLMTEEAYIQFICDTTTQNPKIIPNL